MKRWIAPLIAMLLTALGAWYVTLELTPYVLMELAERRLARAEGFNHFFHAPPVDARHQTIVRPSPDLLYSSCPYDLTKGPLEVRATPIPGHYSSISVFDGRTDVAAVRNDEAMAGHPIRLIVALGGQQVPAGADVVRVTMPRGIVLQRVLLADPSEAATIDPLRRAAWCGPLGRAPDSSAPSPENQTLGVAPVAPRP